MHCYKYYYKKNKFILNLRTTVTKALQTTKHLCVLDAFSVDIQIFNNTLLQKCSR